MSFSADVGKWAKKAVSDFEDFRKAVILELFNSVIMDTPVKTGRLRGNWIISSGAPQTDTVEITDPDGKTTTKKVEDFANKLPMKDGTVFLANNLPYAYRIEFEGWSHTKAPEGMVRKNFIRVSNNLKRYGNS